MVAKISYTDYTTINLIPAPNDSYEYFYRMNTPYYPRTNISPEDTPGLVEYSNMYGRYRVRASSIRVTVNNPLAADMIDWVVAPYVGAATPSAFNGPSTPDAVKQSMGNPYAKSTFSLPGKGPSTLYNYITMEKLVGSVEPATSDNWAAVTGSGGVTVPAVPAKLAYWYVAATSHAGLAVSENVQFIVKINYWVEFYSRDFEFN